MLTRKKRPAIWLIAGLIALILLVACNPAGTAGTEVQSAATEVTEQESAADDPVTAEPDDEETTLDVAEASNDEAADEETEATPEEPEDAEPEVEESATEEPATEELVDSETDQADEMEENEDDPADAADEDEAVVAEPVDGIFTDDSRDERQRLISENWNTDFNRHTVPYDELLALLPVRDGIPGLDNPNFISPDAAAEWLFDNEPVIVYENNGDARAYPLQIMTWHEIVNDVVGDLPVTVTFCPLCNSAIVFDRNLNGEIYDFGTSGWLRNSDLVMYDRQTESLWQQFTGEGLVGELAGEQLTFLPSSTISFGDFRETFPDGLVLSRQTGHQRRYGENPYPGYDAIGQNPFAFTDVPDGRLAAMERVIAVSLDEVDVAYPLTLLFDEGVINDSQGGQDLVIFHAGGTSSALDNPIIFLGADVGATGVFDPELNGEMLTFSKEADEITDDQTGSTWNILGQAVDGPLAGEELTPLVHGDHFWFAWAAFQPETIIFGS